MPKLKLVAAPTFSASVGVPVAGEASVPVKMTFKHRTKSVLDEWIKTRDGKSDTDSFLEMVEGWDLDEPFNQESVYLFLEIYGGAAVATYQTYVNELLGARVKN